MRVYAKRLFLIFSGALGTTFLVALLNSLSTPGLKDTDARSSKEGADSKIWQRIINRTDGKFVKSIRNSDLLKKEAQDGQNENLNGINEKEEEWEKDDQAVVPVEPSIQIQRANKRALDPKIINLKDLMHLDEVRPEDECPNKTTVGEYFRKKFRKLWPVSDSWNTFYAQIGTCDLYRENSTILDKLLYDLSNLPIVSVVNMEEGTQIKLVFTFENGKLAIFKPMRFSRLYETHPNHFYFGDFERHHAEIAAFHLDKVLGFRRAVPTVGRVLNMTSDLWAKADSTLAKTFFYSPVKNLCFVGRCDYYCDTTHAICGKPDLKEGSVQMFLPDEVLVPRDHNSSPYKRTYSKRNQEAEWQKDPSYCDWKVKYSPPFTNGRRLLDLVDLYILDFLMGNQDRHHYETFAVFEGYPAIPVHLDNGRAFGRPRFDDMSILAPLSQCCVIRPSTAQTLFKYYLGPISLADALRESMSKDQVAPILAEKYLRAIDRRVEIILRELGKCLDKANGDYRKVLMTTFHNPNAPQEGDLFLDNDD